MRLRLWLRRLISRAPCWFYPRVCPSRAAAFRIGSGSAVERGFQDAVENIGHPVCAFGEPIAKTIGITVAIELPFERTVAPFLPRALLLVAGLPKAAA